MEMPGKLNEVRKRVKQPSREEHCTRSKRRGAEARKCRACWRNLGGQDGRSTRITRKSGEQRLQWRSPGSGHTGPSGSSSKSRTWHDHTYISWLLVESRPQGTVVERVKHQEAPATAQVKDVGDMDTGARVGAETSNCLLDTFQKLG